MILNLLITGIVTGFLVAMPVGPIGILIVQRTLNKSRMSGLMSGLGAALADLFYALVAGYSLTFLIELVREHQQMLQIIGGVAVIAVGLHIFFKHPARDFRRFRKRGNTPFQDLSSTFLLTSANPVTLFAFLGLFASSGLAFDMERPWHNVFLVSGVFLGACGWWLTLTETVFFFKHRFSLRVLWWFNKIAGVAVVLFVLISLSYAYISGIRI